MEDGFDWAYALVSADAGKTWTSVKTNGTTNQDLYSGCGSWGDCKNDGPLGGSKRYPNGFTGASGSPPTFSGQNFNGPVYAQQTADLSPWAGKSVLIRFAYTSDASTSDLGFYVDDVTVAGHADAMEATGGWASAGNPGFTWVTKSSG